MYNVKLQVGNILTLITRAWATIVNNHHSGNL